ncbi:MAG: RDD family protein [Gammaproteobacteria bacterium]|nr:RDD family protein [Gammaproteobacteria bacterium]
MTPAPATRAPLALAANDDHAGWQPAGFWRRYLAWSLDALLLSPVLIALAAPAVRESFAAANRLVAALQGWMMDRVFSADGAITDPLVLARQLMADPQQRVLVSAQMDLMATAVLQACLLVASVAAVYFIGFEASRWQATPGKRLLGVQVQSEHGGRLGLARTAMRFFAGSLSWLSLNLGHALAGWRKDGRALHDLLAGARVSALGPMPAWARALLWAQLALLVLLSAGMLLRIFWMLGQIATA